MTSGEVMTSAKDIQSVIRKQADPSVAAKSLRFFKTGDGDYGAGDLFLGLRVPQLRQIAKDYKEISLKSNLALLKSKYHEERLCALYILVLKYEKATTDLERSEVYKAYLQNFQYVNNWDLVDASTPYIVGRHLMSRNRKILYTWARSSDMWTRRIAMVANWWWIRQGDLSEVFKLSKQLLGDKEDLMHKAVGWMLREAGKKDQSQLQNFLETNYEKLPRTTLRYAIEKFPEAKRKRILKGDFR